MKVTIEIDCTPEEARRFLGLPDVQPMQAAVMDRLQQQMLDATAKLSPEALLRAWVPAQPQTPEQVGAAMAAATEPMRAAMQAFLAQFTPPGPPKG